MGGKPRQRRAAERRLWARALEATEEGNTALAMVLIARYRSARPANVAGRLLEAINLSVRRQFDAADVAFDSIAPDDEAPHHVVWLSELPEHRERKGELAGAEEALREATESGPNRRILLGAFLARRGRLDEAEEAHARATSLPGDSDEAYLNFGLIYRARGRLEEARAALLNALDLCSDYPEAQRALDDVEVALREQSRSGDGNE